MTRSFTCRSAILILLLSIFTYIYGLDSRFAPKNGDEYPYMHIVRMTAQTGQWLPLQSEMEGLKNTKPPLLFWEGIASTHWGESWRIQMAAAAVCILTGFVALQHRRFRPLYTLATVGFAASLPMLGHAAGSVLRMAVDVAHILAGGVWLGSLAVVVLTTIGRPQQIRVAILLRFSAVALPGAGIVVAAGLIAAWLYLGKVSDLWLTDYGRVLAL